MPATGYTPISLYYSTTASATPSAGNLANGELAININTADGKLYYKDSAGSVQLLASKAGATGTVSSVAQSFTGGLISVSGSPITTSGTLALTVAGTSGGVPYFSSASTWASSAALTANAIMVGGGAGSAPSTVTTGTGVITGIGNNTDTSAGFVTGSGTVTLTNKRIDPRVSSSASASSLTPDVSSYDIYAYTALAASLTINAPTGTPVDGDRLIFRILDNGTSQTLLWNITFTAIGVTIPGATTANKTLYVGCLYNANNTRWDVVSVSQQI
jgi:hypothetical protein